MVAAWAAGLILAMAVQSPPKTLVDRGRALYEVHCSTCHGADLGGSENGPPLRGVGAAAVDFMLRTGRMPAEAPGVEQLSAPRILTAQEIRAIVAFAIANGAGNSPPIPKVQLNNNVAEGRKLYDDNCQACHGASAEGAIVGFGWIAPPLAPADPVTVAEAVRFGPGEMPRFNEHQIPNDKLDDLVSYAMTLRKPADIGGYPLAHEGPSGEGLAAWFFGLGSTCTVMVLVGQTLRSRQQPNRDEPR
jgi:ubiquinol-cytochrome c reductase cytochrome c subunit